MVKEPKPVEIEINQDQKMPTGIGIDSPDVDIHKLTIGDDTQLGNFEQIIWI